MVSHQQRIRKWFTPRQNTDLQSEILNLIAGPIYVYTITCVYIYGILYMIPYIYGPSDQRDGNYKTVMFTFQMIFATIIYVEMMGNWLCIVFVDNSMKKSKVTKGSGDADHSLNGSLNSVIVHSGTESFNRSGKGVIPAPQSAPITSKKQSYWSWKVCQKCHIKTPPRCHHCPLCETCILKRDHHCFFTRKCIGFYNQRHFIVFCAWAAFGTTYATIHFLIYYFKVLVAETSSWDVFAPFALVRWIFGDGSLAITNTMFTFTFNFLFIFLSSGFVLDQAELVREGLTQFEQKNLDQNKLRIVDPRPFSEKLRSVLGCNYGLSFILPFAHVFFPPHENPFEWPEIKIYKGGL